MPARPAAEVTAPAARRETWLRYVPHGQLVLFLARGWRISNDLAGTHHGEYSVLMVWPHESEPPK